MIIMQYTSKADHHASIHGDDKETCVCVEYDFHHLGGLMVGRTIMLCGCKRSAGALNSCLRAKPVFL